MSVGALSSLSRKVSQKEIKENHKIEQSSVGKTTIQSHQEFFLRNKLGRLKKKREDKSS